MAWSRGGGEGRFLTFLVASSRVQSSPGMSSLIHLRTSVTVFHPESRHCEDCPTKKLADLSRNSSSRFILFSFSFISSCARDKLPCQSIPKLAYYYENNFNQTFSIHLLIEMKLINYNKIYNCEVVFFFFFINPMIFAKKPKKTIITVDRYFSTRFLFNLFLK